MEKTVRSRFAAIQPPRTRSPSGFLVTFTSHLSRYRHNRPAESVIDSRRPSWHSTCTADAMRKLPLLVFLLAVISSTVLAAQDSGAQKRFAGLWEAKLKDKVICAIKLEAAQTISGAVLACQIHVNGDGELIEQESSDASDDKPEPILDPKVQGDTLSFAVKDEDDEQPLKFELKLTGEAQAELRILNAPAPVKPIHFEKK